MSVDYYGFTDEERETYFDTRDYTPPPAEPIRLRPSVWLPVSRTLLKLGTPDLSHVRLTPKVKEWKPGAPAPKLEIRPYEGEMTSQRLQSAAGLNGPSNAVDRDHVWCWLLDIHSTTPARDFERATVSRNYATRNAAKKLRDHIYTEDMKATPVDAAGAIVEMLREQVALIRAGQTPTVEGLWEPGAIRGYYRTTLQNGVNSIWFGSHKPSKIEGTKDPVPERKTRQRGYPSTVFDRNAAQADTFTHARGRKRAGDKINLETDLEQSTYDEPWDDFWQRVAMVDAGDFSPQLTPLQFESAFAFTDDESKALAKRLAVTKAAVKVAHKQAIEILITAAGVRVENWQADGDSWALENLQRLKDRIKVRRKAANRMRWLIADDKGMMVKDGFPDYESARKYSTQLKKHQRNIVRAVLSADVEVSDYECLADVA